MAAGHEVLTGTARGPDGLPHVASFGLLPHPEGSGAILRLLPDGAVDVAVDGLTTTIDLSRRVQRPGDKALYCDATTSQSAKRANRL